MMVLDEVLESLADGKWHSLDELEKVTGKKTWEVVSFFHDFGFIRMDWRNLRVKASKKVLEFLKATSKIERNKL